MAEQENATTAVGEPDRAPGWKTQWAGPPESGVDPLEFQARQDATLRRETIRLCRRLLDQGVFQVAIVAGAGFAIGSGLIAAVVGLVAWAITGG